MRLRTSVGFLLCLWLLAGCTSNDGIGSATHGPGTQSESLFGVPEEQRAFFEDGEVTRAEYRAAVENAAACVAEKGWTVDEIFEVPNFRDRLSFNVIVPNAADEEQINADMNECLTTYSDDAEVAYLRSLVPTGVEREEMLRSLVDCLHDVGVASASIDMDEAAFVTAIVSTLPEDRITSGFACMDSHALLFRD